MSFAKATKALYEETRTNANPRKYLARKARKTRYSTTSVLAMENS